MLNNYMDIPLFLMSCSQTLQIFVFVISLIVINEYCFGEFNLVRKSLSIRSIDTNIWQYYRSVYE